MLMGGEEADLLWNATVDAFVAGNWVATLQCAQATCERAPRASSRTMPHQDRPGPAGCPLDVLRSASTVSIQTSGDLRRVSLTSGTSR